MYLFNIPVGQVREKITVIFSKLNNPASLGRCVGLKINTKSRGTQWRLFAVNNTGSVWLSLFFRFDGVSAIFVNWNLQILFEDDEFKRVNIRRQLIFLPNWHYIRSRFIDGLFSTDAPVVTFSRLTGSLIQQNSRMPAVLSTLAQASDATRYIPYYLRVNIKHSTWTKVKLGLSN